MKNLKHILTIASVAFGLTSLNAQVQLKIERMGETNNFLVSGVSGVSYDNPKNMTSTAQVTLMAPTGDFEINKIVNLYPNATWRMNGRSNAPKENPGQDYIYFGLENLGTTAFEFRKGKDIPLFVIQAKTCNSTLGLMDNQSDAFKYPNSEHVNVGNQLTVFGAGGDAYAGLVGDKAHVNCLTTKASTLNGYQLRISPNVTSENTVKVEFMKDDKDSDAATMSIYDASGRAVMIEKLTPKKGYNSIETDITPLVNGCYFVVLEGLKTQPIMERLVILN